jgi:hypothetical protein
MTNIKENIYSKKEISLFKHFGVDYFLGTSLECDPMTIYRQAVEVAFLEDMSGPMVESLRRCMKALKLGVSCGKPYRGIGSGFDNLIEFE